VVKEKIRFLKKNLFNVYLICACGKQFEELRSNDYQYHKKLMC